MPRNIALIILDTVRADVFQENAPNIQSRADLSYTNCLSGSSWTVPSHSSMLTGSLPSASANGVHARNPHFDTLNRRNTLFNSLSAYHCIGVSANGFLTPQFGFDRFFDTFTSFYGNEVIRPGGLDMVAFLEDASAGWSKYPKFIKAASESSNLFHTFENAMYMKYNDIARERSLPRFGDYGTSLVLSESKRYLKTAPEDKPKFLFMNVVDAHDPHEPTSVISASDVPLNWTSSKISRWSINNTNNPDQYTQYFNYYRSLYSSSVSYVDKKISNFISWVTDNVSGETTFIITSDHGELLGYANEKHHIEHQSGLQFPLIHVPFEIVNPPKTLSALDLDTPISLLQLPDLISDIATGTELFSCCHDIKSERIGIFQAPDENTEYWDRTVRSVYKPNILYRWDSLGSTKSVRCILPSEETTTTDLEELPSKCINAFPVDMDDLRDRHNNITHPELESATQRQLEGLGYL